MTLAAAPPPDLATQTSSEAFTSIPEHLDCPNCGTDVTALCADTLARSQCQLSDLEAQVRLLNQKATAAGKLHPVHTYEKSSCLLEIIVDKWADYEDELHTLRRHLSDANTSREKASTPTPAPTQSRFSFLSPRKQSSSLPTPQHSPHQSTSTSSLSPNSAASLLPPPPPLPEKDAQRPYPSPLDLAAAETAQLAAKLDSAQQALRHEKLLRQQAEEKALAGGRELEDLTQQLFEEANKMVVVERKARAKLEERLQVLEERDRAKRDSLKLLEGAIARIERVRSMVKPDPLAGEEEWRGEEPVVIKTGRIIGRKS